MTVGWGVTNGNTSVHMLACLVSSKFGAGMPFVPSVRPLFTSRHWLTFAVESLKKLYKRTYMALKIDDTSVGWDLHR